MGNPKKKQAKCGFCGFPEYKCKCASSKSKSVCDSSCTKMCCVPKPCCEKPKQCSSSSSQTCESSSTVCCESSSSTVCCESSSSTVCCESPSSTVCCESSSSCSSSSISCKKSCDDDDAIVRIEGFLQAPVTKGCVNTYLLASCADPCDYTSPPTIMLQARDQSWHFPGEQPPGLPFWLIITPNQSLVLAMPQQTACQFPLGSKYILTIFSK